MGERPHVIGHLFKLVNLGTPRPVDKQAVDLRLKGLLVLDIYICLTLLTRAKLKEKNEICCSISTRAVKCDGVFFVLQHGF